MKTNAEDQELLTADEVVKLLRLDKLGLKYPKEALRHMRRMKRIGFVRINRRILYTREDVEHYIAENHVNAGM